MKQNTVIIAVLLAAVILGGAVVYFGGGSADTGPGALDEFATCLKDKGVIFYGAFWCPHCQATKKMFGNSERLLPYVECSTSDGQGQLKVCKDAGITSYPTWVFPDGTRMNGERTLAELSERSQCALPAEEGGAFTSPEILIQAPEEATSSPAGI